jgi:hypothetical protein
MRWRCVVGAALVAVLAVTASSLAERAPEDRKAATHVVVGTVEGVYVRGKEEFHNYVIELTVEKVEKGKGPKAGETLYVRCYLWNSDYHKGKKLSKKEEKQIALRWSSYNGVPKEGQRVRVYVKHRSGKYDGTYPDWYEVVKRKPDAGK